MRYNRWQLLACVLGVAAFTHGCTCGGPQITNASGDGKFAEQGPNGSKSYVDATTVDFGAVLTGTRVERKVDVHNDGLGILEIASLSPSTPFDAVFTYDFPPTFSLDIQEDKQYSVYFQPTDADAGDHTSTLTFNLGNAVNQPPSIVLTIKGHAVKGGCEITPSDTLDFGAVALGTTYVKSVKIANPSEIDWTVNVAGIISESDPGTFVFSNFTAGQITVPAHSETLVPVEFKPNHIGTHSAALSIPDPSMCQIVLPITGNGVDDVLQCTPQVQVKDPTTGRTTTQCLVNFGYVNPPKGKATGQVTFQNLGNDDLTVSGLTLVQDPKGNVFAIEAADPTATVTVPKSGGSAQVTLSFLPSILGNYSGAMKYTSNDAKAQSGTVTLVGVGGGPQVDVEPTAIDFGVVAVGTYQHRRLTVANVGTDIAGTTDDDLTLMVPDPTPGAKSCAQDSDCTSQVCLRSQCWVDQKASIQSATDEFSLDWPPDGYQAPGIAAGQSVDLKIKFTPTSPGDKSADVTIYTNDPSNPQVVVHVTAHGQTMPPCDFEVSPPQLTFGNVENSKTEQLSFFIRNRAQACPGSDPHCNDCLLSTLGLSHGSSTSFALVNGPVTSATIAGGAAYEVPVRFSPKADGSYSATVEFYISSPTSPEGSVALSGSSQSGCLMIAPNQLDFGVIQPGCSSRDRDFTAYNVCTGNQHITGIDLQQSLSQEFFIVEKPVMDPNNAACKGTPCYELTPGNSVGFKVKYSPVDVGTDQGSLAVSTLELAAPYVIPLTGKGDTAAIQTDIFAQDPQPKVDVLFVVDDSGSMMDHQQSMGKNFASFIQFAVAQGVDYHVMVTTTGVDTAHGGGDDNPDYPGADLNGCYFKPFAAPWPSGSDPYPQCPTPLDPSTCPCMACPNPPAVLTQNTPDIEHCFACAVLVGTDGNSVELLDRPAYLALTNPDLSSCNDVGFLRDDANLAVVVVSDAFDQDNAGTNGPLPYSFYLNAFYNIKGLKNQNMFTFNAIHPMHYNTATCTQDGSEPEAPDPWVNDARVVPIIQATAGIEGDICTEDWATTLQSLGQTAFGYRTRFFLLNVPDTTPGHDITVQLQGVNDPAPQDFPAIDPKNPTSPPRWAYNSAANAIDFQPAWVPDPGTTVLVSYHVACLH